MASNERTGTDYSLAIRPGPTASTPVPSPINIDRGRVTAGSTDSEGSETASPASPQMLGDMGSRPGSSPSPTPGSAPGLTPGSTAGSAPGSTPASISGSNEEAERVRSEVREAHPEAERRESHNSIISILRALNNCLDKSQAFFATKPDWVKYLAVAFFAGAGGGATLLMVESAASHHDEKIIGWRLAGMIAFIAASGGTTGMASQLFVGRIGFFEQDEIFWTILVLITWPAVVLAFGFYADSAK